MFSGILWLRFNQKKKKESVAVAVVVANAKNPNPLHQEGRIKAKIPEIS